MGSGNAQGSLTHLQVAESIVGKHYCLYVGDGICTSTEIGRTVGLITIRESNAIAANATHHGQATDDEQQSVHLLYVPFIHVYTERRTTCIDTPCSAVQHAMVRPHLQAHTHTHTT